MQRNLLENNGFDEFVQVGNSCQQHVMVMECVFNMSQARRNGTSRG